MYVVDVSAQYNYSYDTSSSNGPYNWYQLPNSKQCRTGTQQSPINIVTTLNAQQLALQNIGFTTGLDSMSQLVTQADTFHPINTNNYHSPSSDTFILNNTGNILNGTFNTNAVALPTVNYSSTIYTLQYMLFHTPSEHTLNQQSADMDIQLIHRDLNTNKQLILSIFMIVPYSNSNNNDLYANTFLSSIQWTNSSLPQNPGDTITIPYSTINMSTILPSNNQSYFEYTGSLTTPPCTSPITWLIYQQPLNISLNQKLYYTNLFGTSTVRPLQNVNGRTVNYYVQPTIDPVTLANNPVADQLLATILLCVVGVASIVLFISRDVSYYTSHTKQILSYIYVNLRPSSAERQFTDQINGSNDNSQYDYSDQPNSDDTSYEHMNGDNTDMNQPNTSNDGINTTTSITGRLHLRQHSLGGEL